MVVRMIPIGKCVLLMVLVVDPVCLVGRSVVRGAPVSDRAVEPRAAHRSIGCSGRCGPRARTSRGSEQRGVCVRPRARRGVWCRTVVRPRAVMVADDRFWTVALACVALPSSSSRPAHPSCRHRPRPTRAAAACGFRCLRSSPRRSPPLSITSELGCSSPV